MIGQTAPMINHGENINRDFARKEYTEALITGRAPFWDENNDIKLIIKICKNFRPPMIKDAPKGYTKLMQECWDSDPNKRPTVIGIHNC